MTGDPDRPPARVALPMTDYMTAIFAAYGAVMALLQREKTGRGQIIDAALYETAFTMMEAWVPVYDRLGLRAEARWIAAAGNGTEQSLSHPRWRLHSPGREQRRDIPASDRGHGPARICRPIHAFPIRARGLSTSTRSMPKSSFGRRRTTPVTRKRSSTRPGFPHRRSIRSPTSLTMNITAPATCSLEAPHPVLGKLTVPGIRAEAVRDARWRPPPWECARSRYGRCPAARPQFLAGPHRTVEGGRRDRHRSGLSGTIAAPPAKHALDG